jgi:hypothetical protein
METTLLFSDAGERSKFTVSPRKTQRSAEQSQDRYECKMSSSAIGYDPSRTYPNNQTQLDPPRIKCPNRTRV